MFSPVTLLEEGQREKQYLSDIANAEAYFQEQVDAVKAIKDTRGYKEIVRYWQREWEAKVLYAWEMQSSDIADYKAIHREIALCQKFLNFLEMMN